ncbi:MAG TPA: RodZ domain-containing protein [Candidatus Macondimonas sp.]|nr:RodZ domain-containing protein [Candidatus Macondimonas sp.]
MTPPVPDADSRNHASPRPEGFGALLRAAREARGLDRQDVADALRLSPRMVEAIELEDLASLPPPLFIKGYLRSYAVLVGLDETALVRDFESWVPTTDPLQMIPVRKRSNTDLSDVGRGRQLASAILLLVVLAAVVFWWLQPAPTPTPVLAIEESESIQDPDVTANPASEGLAEAQAVSQPETPADEQVVTGNARAPDAAEPVETAPSSPPVIDSPRAAEPDSAPVTDASPSAVAGKPADAPDEAQRTAVLKIRYQEDCWTEVRDARGRQLIYRLAKAGSEQEVSGDPPFSFYLGYAPGVAVEIDGQAVPITDLVGNSTVARFKLERPQ